MKVRLGLLWFVSAAASLLAAPGEIKWIKELSGHAPNPVLTLSGDVIVGDDTGKVFCFSPAGSNRWEFASPQDLPFSPAVAPDGTVLIPSSKLYALNPNEGTVKWVFDAKPGPTAFIFRFKTPTVGPDGVIYAPTYADASERGLFAINPDGTERWSVHIPLEAPAVILPSGKLVIRSDYHFGVLNPDGAKAWEYLYAYGHHESAALTTEGNIILPRRWSDEGAGGWVESFNSNGARNWGYHSQAVPAGSPVIGNSGRIYFPDYSGRITALTSAGAFLWDYQITNGVDGDRILSAAAVTADETIYFTANGILYALDGEGEKLREAPSGLPFSIAPLIAPDGTVYFTALDRNGAAALVAVEGTGSGPAQSSWPMFLRNAQHHASLATGVTVPSPSTNITASMDQFTDKVVVNWSSSEGAVYYDLYRSVGTNDPSAIAESITGRTSFEDRSAEPGTDYSYSVRSRNSAGQSGFSGAATGRRRVALIGQAAWIFPTRGAIRSHPAMAPDGSVYAGSSDGFVYALDSAGLLRWKFPYGGSTVSAIALGTNGNIYFTAGARVSEVYFEDQSFHLFALRPDGSLAWKLLLDGRIAAPVSIGADGTILISDGPTYHVGNTTRIIAVTPAGTKRWTLDPGGYFFSAPTIGAGGKLYAASVYGRIYAVSANGEMLWEQGLDDWFLQAPIHDSRGVLYFGGGKLHSLNPDGVLHWTLPTINGGAAAGCIGPNDTLYAYVDQHLIAYKTNRAELWKAHVGGFNAIGFAVDQAENLYANVGSQLSVYDNSGTSAWSFRPNANLLAGPVLAHTNLVLVGSETGELIALRTAAPIAQVAWPQTSQDAANTQRADTLQPLPNGAVVVGVQATDRTRVTDVLVRWNSFAGAEEYEIYRSRTADPSTATQIASVTGHTSYLDKLAAPETEFFYWIKAKNAVSITEVSNQASGKRRQAVDGELLETWELGGKVESPPAFTAAGDIYVSVSAIPLQNPPAQPALLSIHPHGRVNWRLTLPVQSLTPPSVAPDGTVFVGTLMTTFMDPIPPSTVYAVRPDGTIKWEFQSSSGVAGTPVIDPAGNVYFATTDGRIYSLASNGEPRWTNINNAHFSTPLSIGPDNAIYAYAENGDLYSLSSNGSLRWKVRPAPAFDRRLRQPVTIGREGTLYLAGSQGGIFALGMDGLRHWSAHEDQVFVAPLLDTTGTLTAISAGLARLSTVGSNLFSTNLNLLVSSMPALTDQRIIVPTSNGSVLTLTPEGTMDWQLSAAGVLGHIGIAPDGLIYVGSDDGKLRSIYGTQAQMAEQWTGYQQNPRRTGAAVGFLPTLRAPTNLVASVNTYNNRVALSWSGGTGGWRYEIWRGPGTNISEFIQLATVAGTNSFADFTADEGVEYHYALRTGNDAEVSEFSPLALGIRKIALPGEIIAEVTFIGAQGNGLALVGDLLIAGVEGGLIAYNSGLAEAWKVSNGTLSYGPPSIHGTNIYVGRNDSRIFSFDNAGQPLWMTNLPFLNNTIPLSIAADETLYTTSNGRTLVAISPAGQVIWQKPLTATIGMAPLIAADGTIYTALSDQVLIAYSPAGTERWRLSLPCRPLYPPALGADGTIYWPATDRRLYAITPRGTILWSFQIPAGNVTGVSIAPDGSIYFGGTVVNRLYVLRPDGTKLREFPVEGFLARPPLLAADGSALFGTSAGVVYALDGDGKLLWRTASTLEGLRDFLLLDDGRFIVIGRNKLIAIRTAKAPALHPWPMAYQDPRRTSRMPGGFQINLAPFASFHTGDTLQLNPQITGFTPALFRIKEGTNLLWSTTNVSLPIAWSGLRSGTNRLVFEIVDTNQRLYSSYLPLLGEMLALEMLPIESSQVLQIRPLPNRQYALEASSNLLDWEDINAPATNIAGVLRWPIIPAAQEVQLFYRVRSN